MLLVDHSKDIPHSLIILSILELGVCVFLCVCAYACK